MGRQRTESGRTTKVVGWEEGCITGDREGRMYTDN